MATSNEEEIKLLKSAIKDLKRIEVKREMVLNKHKRLIAKLTKQLKTAKSDILSLKHGVAAAKAEARRM